MFRKVFSFLNGSKPVEEAGEKNRTFVIATLLRILMASSESSRRESLGFELEVVFRGLARRSSGCFPAPVTMSWLHAQQRKRGKYWAKMQAGSSRV
jgi:hypothetical protein